MHPFASLKATGEFRCLAAPRERDKIVQILSKYLCLRIEEHLFKGRVAELHPMIWVHNHDANWPVRNQCLQVRRALTELLFVTCRGRHVECSPENCRLALELNHGRAEIHPPFFSTASQNLELITRGDVLAGAPCHCPFKDQGTEVWMHKVPDIHPGKFLRRVSADLHDLGVEVIETFVMIDPDRARGRLGHKAKLGLTFSKRRLSLLARRDVLANA